MGTDYDPKGFEHLDPYDGDAWKEPLNRCLAILTEHYECVHIFASKYDSETKDTTSVNRGLGNWHARLGQLREFLLREEEAMRVAARRAADQHEEDGTNTDQ